MSSTVANAPPQFLVPHADPHVQSPADGEDEEEYGDESDEGDDYDAEAEEMARRLQEQLHADIAKAQLEAAAVGLNAAPAPMPSRGSHKGPSHCRHKRYEAAILTMKGILSFASNSPLVHSTLSAATVSVADHANVLAVFDRCIASGVVSSKIARELSEAVVTLAKSDVLFASLKNSDAPVLQLDRRKRKRTLPDEPAAPAADARAPKRVALDQPDLRAQLSEAVRAISHAFAAASLAPGQPPDPALISSLQLPLHHVFLFAVTSAPRAAERTPALQELAGIIQMLGVLTGIPIGAGPAHPPPPPPPWSAYAPAAPPPPAGMQDLGSAVYPCLLPGCQKTFHRLYSLRAHQRLHTVVERPFRCAHCPASFVRNHDLKRHTKLHDRKAWKCAGCAKVFSRRDAIKRHKDSRRPGGKVRGADADVLGESVCAYADIEEVEVERAPGEEEGSRRTKLWNEVAFHASPPCTVTGHENVHEEGEVEPGILEEVQQIVLRLHGLLQAYVASGLGGGPAAAGQTQPPQASQATLASVIARTQQAGPPPAPSAGPSRDQTVEPLSPATIPSPSLPSTLALSEEQTKLLEQAIAQAALAAQAQAEAEAALEEEDEDGSDIDEDEGLN